MHSYVRITIATLVAIIRTLTLTPINIFNSTGTSLNTEFNYYNAEVKLLTVAAPTQHYC